MSSATFVPENAWHHFTCRHNCSNFFWWWWVCMLSLLWSSVWFPSEMMCPGFCLGTQCLLTFRKCKCSWMFVFTVPTEIFVSCAISRGYALLIQAFHMLNVHRHDCYGLGTTTAWIITDWRTAVFETFTPFKCLTVSECLIIELWLKPSVDIQGFFTPSFTRSFPIKQWSCK